MAKPRFRSTTILTVRKADVVAMAGDGQVSLGDTVMKADARPGGTDEVWIRVPLAPPVLS